MLWTAVKATLDAAPGALCVIYTGDAQESIDVKLNRIQV